METYNPDMQEMKGKAKKIMNRVKKTGVEIVIALVVPVLGFSSVYNIWEQEQTMLTALGIANSVTQPGLRFKIPFTQNAQKVNITIQGFAFGYNPGNNESEEEDSLMITRDHNFANVDFFIEYKVANPVKVVYASGDPLPILKNISENCTRSVIGSYDVDAALTAGKNKTQSNIKTIIIQKLEQHDVGFQVVSVTIQNPEPPTVEVMEAFKVVETAKQGKETFISNTSKYQDEEPPGATAETDKILREAESFKTQCIDEANADVAGFNAMYEEYMENPQVTKQRMFYKTAEGVLPRLKVIIDGTDRTGTILPLDSFTSQMGSSPANSQTASSQNTGGEEQS